MGCCRAELSVPRFLKVAQTFYLHAARADALSLRGCNVGARAAGEEVAGQSEEKLRRAR